MALGGTRVGALWVPFENYRVRHGLPIGVFSESPVHICKSNIQYRSKGCAACATAQGAEGRGRQNCTL